MIVDLSSTSTNFKFSERTFYILENGRPCVVRIEAVMFTHIVGKQVASHPFPSSTSVLI